MAIKDNRKEEDKEVEQVMVDIMDTSLLAGVEQDIDINEDWQSRACPPPKGRYRLKLTIADNNFEQGVKQGFARTDPNGIYYKKEVSCKIQSDDPKIKDSIVNYRVSTGVMRGKNMSTMAGILVLAGFRLKPRVTDLELAKFFAKAISQKEPILIADTDWEVWDSEDRDNMKVLVKGMDKFPKDAKGVPQHIVRNKKGVEFVAKLKVIKWYPAKAPVAAPVAPVAQVKQTVAPAPIVDDLAMSGGGFQPVSAGAVQLGDDDEVIMD